MPSFSITMVWLDGTEALTGTIGLDDLQALFDNDNNLTGQVAWDTLVGFVNDTNFNTTKMFLMFLLQDDNYNNRDKGIYPE